MNKYIPNNFFNKKVNFHPNQKYQDFIYYKILQHRNSEIKNMNMILSINKYTPYVYIQGSFNKKLNFF